MSDIQTLAKLVLGGAFDATELGENDIQPDSKLIEELQQRLVSGSDDVYIDLVDRAHVIRLTAERDALQLLLNERDEQNHSLEQRRQAEQQACMAAERRVVEFQSELTKARELLLKHQFEYLPHSRCGVKGAGYYCVQCRERKDNGCTPSCELEAIISNQYAPADKGQGGPLSELEVLRASVKELEAMRDARVDAKLSQGEPVAWLAQAIGKDGEVYRITASPTEITMRDVGFAWGQGVIDRFTIVIKPLYAEQPAPVAVVLPERVNAQSHWPEWRVSEAKGRNECLDEVASLNPIKQ